MIRLRLFAADGRLRLEADGHAVDAAAPADFNRICAAFSLQIDTFRLALGAIAGWEETSAELASGRVRAEWTLPARADDGFTGLVLVRNFELAVAQLHRGWPDEIDSAFDLESWLGADD